MKVKMIEYFDDHYYRVEDEDGSFEYYPSYTTKLSAAPKPFLAKWCGDIGNREAELRVFEASERGKRIHYADNIFVNGGIILYNPYQCPNYSDEQIVEFKKENTVFILQYQDEMIQTIRFRDWWNEVCPVLLGSEKIVYDHERKEAGTADLIIKTLEDKEYNIAGAKPLFLPKGIYITDIKSGSAIYDEAYLQVSGYREAYNKMHKDQDGFEPATGGLIIHTNAKTKKGIEGLATHYRTAEQMDEDYEAFKHIAATWDRNNKSRPKYIEFPSLVTLNTDDLINTKEE